MGVGCSKTKPVVPQPAQAEDAEGVKQAGDGTPDPAHGTFVVEGAGAQGANGVYHQDSLADGVPTYVKDDHVLLRYRMSSGNAFWYITSRSAAVHQAAGDLYRVKCESASPPNTGWKCDAACPDGLEPAPTVKPAGSSESAPCAPACPEAAPSPQSTGTDVTMHLRTVSGQQATVTLQSLQLLSELRELTEARLNAGRRQRAALIKGTRRFQDVEESRSLEELELCEGDELLVVFEAASFMALGAGLQKVNGRYVQREELCDGVPSYTNGDVVLLRYRMHSGNAFWYFTSLTANVHQSSGDYYRVKSPDDTPPLEGWSCPPRQCPDGEEPPPTLEIA